MDNERKLKGYGRTATTFEENGVLYILKDTQESRTGRGNFTHTYVEIDKKEYMKRLKSLAKQIASNPAVKVEDIIYDALKDYPLGHIETYEKAVAREMNNKKPDIKTKPGHCCELVIGGSYSFILRN